MLALLSFLALIIVVVSVHEFGHYWVARRFGVRVLRFSVGFGKPLWSFKDARQTEWTLAAVPLGGYVRLLDRDTARRHKLPDGETMEAQSNGRRILIYLAGPAANFLLAVLLMTFLLAGGERGLVPTVGAVRADSPAAAAGLRAGDVLVLIDGVLVEHWRDVPAAVREKPQQTVAVAVWRGEAALTLTAVLGERKINSRRRVGYLGVSPTVDEERLADSLVTVTFSPTQLLANAVARAGDDVVRTFSFVRLILTGGASAEHISGPVGIAAESGRAAERGGLAWLHFMALVSTALAVFNLLPLPLLDGGQVVVAMLQLIIRRELPEKFLRFFETIGAAFLLLLMAWVIVNDLFQLWG